MRFGRLGEIGKEIPVVLDGASVFDMRQIALDIDAGFWSSDGPRRVREALSAGELSRAELGGRWGAPIARPGKIVCVGLNYRDHAAETGAPIPTEPVVFMKDPATVVGPYDDVLIPRRSAKTDWEIELGVVIARTARYLESSESALSYIGGFAVSHDVSEREFQLDRGGQWDKGKSCETFNPLGPHLVTPDEVGDVQSLAMSLSVNGVVRQSSSTSEMIFSVAHLVWYLSQFMVLHPGDLVNTGTPAGVALGLEGTPYLRAGDVVELSIHGLGTSRQRLVDA